MKNLKILFTGDFMPGGDFQQKVYERNINLRWPFQKIEHYFNKSDLVFTNFECPVTIGTNTREDKSSILGCSPQIVRFLKGLKFYVLCLANNHIHDYGQEGLINTLKVLKNENMYPLGLSSVHDNVKNYMKIEKNDKLIGFVAFSSDEPWVKSILADSENYGCVFYSRRNIRDGIRVLKRDCDLVIVSMHWGFERHEYPSPLQIEVARYCIDQGADIVIGHHPHLVQGYEIYKSKHIFYSLGNFFFSDFQYKDGGWNRYRGKNCFSLMVGLNLNECNSYSVSLIPTYQQNNYQIRELTTEEKDKYFLHFNSISAKIDMTKKSYKTFWIKYHFLVDSNYLITCIKSAFKVQRLKLKYRLKGIVELIYMLFVEIIKRLFYIEPEKKKLYK